MWQRHQTSTYNRGDKGHEKESAETSFPMSSRVLSWSFSLLSMCSQVISFILVSPINDFQIEIHSSNLSKHMQPMSLASHLLIISQLPSNPTYQKQNQSPPWPPRPSTLPVFWVNINCYTTESTAHPDSALASWSTSLVLLILSPKYPLNTLSCLHYYMNDH